MVQCPDAPGMSPVNAAAWFPNAPVFPVKCGFWDKNQVKPFFLDAGCLFLVTLALNVALGTSGDVGHGPEPFEPLPTMTPTQHSVSHCKRHFVLVVMCN